MAMAPKSQEAKWKAECDLDTLTRAKEIQSDSKRMAAVKTVATKKMAEISAVTKGSKSPRRK